MTLCIHVLGVGAVGMLHAAHLAKATLGSNLSSVVLLLRHKSMMEYYANGGIEWSQSAKVRVTSPIKLQLPAQDINHTSPISTLIITTRAHQTCHALQSVLPRLTRNPCIILLQNGVLGVFDEIQNYLSLTNAATTPDRQIHPVFWLGLTTHGITRSATNRFAFNHIGVGHTLIGRALPSTSIANQYSSNSIELNNTLLDTSQTHCSDSDTVQNVLSVGWKSLSISIQSPETIRSHLTLKLVVNACINPVVALLGCQNGGLLHIPNGLDLVHSLCKELAPLVLPRLSLLGIDSVEKMTDKVMDVVRKTHLNRNSMLVDIDHGRMTEIEYINGYLVKLAKHRGIDLPMHELLTRMIRLKYNQSKSSSVE
ncbi:2-dehydropantoate 2-reductase (Ketopantoate reductase) (KPA reductase) (KPR) [Batrachochytrium dendrobatidis]|nr:2-dehydropantoate 2-reductase (Ketopantoate reductase) (KPA reductase) (KPR) [Batrachochytrium dendrobatidis]